VNKVHLAVTSEDRSRVVELRKKAYSHHNRPMVIELEDIDEAENTALYYTKDDYGRVGASIRVVLGDECMFERLAVTGNRREAFAARQALFKAAFLTALYTHQESVMITTVPPLDRLFAVYGFIEEGTVNLDWFGGTQVQMRLDMRNQPRGLHRVNPTMYDYCMTWNHVNDTVCTFTDKVHCKVM